MNIEFTNEEIRLLDMIAESLCVSGNVTTSYDMTDVDVHLLIELAEKESVLPIVYRALKSVSYDKESDSFVDMANKRVASDFWQFMFIARNTLSIFNKASIKAVILKGASVARLYPVPEARKSTDVDILLIDPDDLMRAHELLENAGYVNEDHSYMNHQREYLTPDGRVLELHTMAVEPTDDVRFNQYVANRFANLEDEYTIEKVLSVNLPVLKDGLQAFQLLLHMAMHFLGEGFGLKLICDWVVFWNRKVENTEIEKFLKDVKECGLDKFMAAITGVCIRYLGLSIRGEGSLLSGEATGEIKYSGGIFCVRLSEDTEDELLREIIDGGRDRKSDTERMVALKGDRIIDYIKEFHHQTVLSFPKASRTIIALPVLYVIVLFRFLRNNRTVRGGQSTLGILRSAGERSRLVKKLF